MGAVELQIVYDAGSHPAIIARTADPTALRVVRTLVLEQAQERAAAMRVIDEPLLAASEEAELHRLQTVLDALVPAALGEMV